MLGSKGRLGLCVSLRLVIGAVLVSLSPLCWASCDGVISDRLNSEPEIVAALQQLNSPGSTLSGLRNAQKLAQNLNSRLRFELYKCNGVCNDEQARIDEIEELKCRFRLIGASFVEPTVDGGWKDPSGYEGKIGAVINGLCEKANPMAATTERDRFKPRTDVETKALYRCIANYAPLQDVLQASMFSKTTPLWFAHIQAWSGCIGKYNAAADLFHQAAYNNCMLTKDSLTKICWDLSSVPLYDICDPAVPTAEDRRQLQSVRGKSTEQLEDVRKQNEGATQATAVMVQKTQAETHARAFGQGAAKYLDAEDVAPANEATETYFNAVTTADTGGQQRALSSLRSLEAKYADRCKGRNPHACQASSSLNQEVLWMTQN